jgi:hypothetical protein
MTDTVFMEDVMKQPNTLIGIQEEYVNTLNAGIARWCHRKDGGHSGRISRGARHVAEKRLRKIGFSDQKQIDQIIKDARDVASLIRNSEED